MEKVGEAGGSEVGAGRILNGVFHETLTAIDPGQYTLSYSIDDGPDVVSKDAVSNYIGTIRLLPVTIGGKTFIEWSSEFDSDTPEAVADFCNPIYAALLDSMVAHYAG